MKKGGRTKGFTIVELLIVIVVIAILAAITVVAYNGIQNRAKSAALQSDIANAAKRIEAAKLQDPSEHYPASLSAAGVTLGGNATYTYERDPSDNSYCVQGVSGDFSWHASSAEATAQQGLCGTDSLVAQWKFNGNANDASSNALHGTVTGATLTSGANGEANGAYSFPGSTASINAGNSTLFNQPEVTMSAWVRPATAAVGTIMAKEGKYKYRFTVSSIQVLAATGTAWTSTITCSVAYTVNAWQHVAFTLSTATGRIKTYYNGAQLCDSAGPTQMTSYPSAGLVIGAYNSGGAEGFNGQMDDARFYKRALGAAEVRLLYQNGAQ